MGVVDFSGNGGMFALCKTGLSKNASSCPCRFLLTQLASSQISHLKTATEWPAHGPTCRKDSEVREWPKAEPKSCSVSSSKQRHAHTFMVRSTCVDRCASSATRILSFDAGCVQGSLRAPSPAQNYCWLGVFAESGVPQAHCIGRVRYCFQNHPARMFSILVAFALPLQVPHDALFLDLVPSAQHPV